MQAKKQFFGPWQLAPKALQQHVVTIALVVSLPKEPGANIIKHFTAVSYEFL
jgi:hypothetical protein